METVDLEKWKRQAEQDVEANYSSMTYGWFRCPPEVALALIRRVERYEKALWYIVRRGYTGAEYVAREALKEES